MRAARKPGLRRAISPTTPLKPPSSAMQHNAYYWYADDKAP